LLTPPERQRAERFRHAIDAHRFTLGRALTRLAVASQLGCSPREVRIELDSSGKPWLQDAAAALSLSISHGGGLVAVALAHGAVGVDVEPRGQAIALDAVLPLVCAPAECEAIMALPQGERERRFLLLWTLKEALLKAAGTGLAGEPSQLVFDLGDEARPLLAGGEHAGRRWGFMLDADVQGHVLALCAQAGLAAPLLRDGGELLAP
jgi:4'-phosphopantetheinyl transferase